MVQDRNGHRLAALGAANAGTSASSEQTFHDARLPTAATNLEAPSSRPKAAFPERPSENRDAQAIFDQIKHISHSPDSRPTADHDSFLVREGRDERKRYFRMNAANQLEEYSQTGSHPDGSPKFDWAVNTQLFVYYYAAGKLYSSKGDLVGDLGIQSAARNLGSHHFLHAPATLQDGEGQMWSYDSRTLTLNGTPAIIAMNPPSGTHQTFRHSTKTILTDAPDRSTFQPLYNDHAYDVVYSKNPVREQRAIAEADLDAVFSGKLDTLAVHCQDGKTFTLRVTRLQDGYAYLANEDGFERIRIKREEV